MKLRIEFDDNYRAMSEGVLLSSISGMPDSAPAKPAGEDKSPSRKRLKDYLFAETNQGVNFSAFGAGFLPVNEEWIKFLILSGYELRRQGLSEGSFSQDIATHAYKIEPQLQFNLLENSRGFLAKSKLFIRSQYDILDNSGNNPTNHNSTNEIVFKVTDETVVLRTDVIVNNLTDAASREVKLVLVPFYKTPALRFGGLRFRVGPEYTRNFTTKEDSLLIHAKIEGTIRNNPWWGWSIQTFWSVDIEGRSDRRNFDFSAIYLWSGAVLPPNWLGEGFFLEGGIFLGKDGFTHGGVPFLKATAVGFNIKFKFGTECRWWQ